MKGVNLMSYQRMVSQPTLMSVKIIMRFNEQVISTGTAFYISNNKKELFLITNRHNVTGRHNETGSCLSPKGAIPNNIVILNHSYNSLGDLVETLVNLKDDDDCPLWLEHPAYGCAVDFVAIKLPYSRKYKAFPYEEITNSLIEVNVGEPSSVIGFPIGKSIESFPIWTTGFLASDYDLNYEGLPRFLIDCRTRKGQSGSPVILHRASGTVHLEGQNIVSATKERPLARLLGIYSGRISEESDLGYVWKFEAVMDLVNSY